MRQARGGFVYSTIFDTDVSNASFRLYVLLTTYADKYGVCWPSNETLAEELRVTVRRVEQMMAELVRLNLVTREPGENHWSPWITRVVRDPDPSGGTRRAASGGTRTSPSGRTNQRNRPEEQTKELAPAGGPGGSVKPVGQIEPEEPTRKAKANLVRPGTRAYVINEWTKYATDLGRRPGNEKIRNGTLNRLHEKDGYTWEQIEKLVRVFFTRYAQDIRAKRDVDLAKMFAQQLNQGLESVAEVQTHEEENEPRPYTTGAEIAARRRQQRGTA